MMIKNIVFDMGNVLVTYDPDQIVKQFIPDPQKQIRVANAIFHSQGWRQLDQGTISYEDFFQQITTQLPELKSEIEWLLANWDRQTTYIPGMFSVIKQLHQRSYHLFILSNANQRYFERQKHLEILRFFKGITLSSEIHLLKPDIRIYQQFCVIHHLDPSECLFIDDQLENVVGARQAGWNTYQFVNTGSLKNHLEDILRINLE